MAMLQRRVRRQEAKAKLLQQDKRQEESRRTFGSVAALGDNAAESQAGVRQPDISLADVSRGQKIASGEFGDVYEGTLVNSDTPSDTPIILKAFKKPWLKGRDVDSFYQSELSMLRILSQRQCESVPEFLGVVGADVYLAWRKEGIATLASAADRKDGESVLCHLMQQNSAAEALKKCARKLLEAVDKVHKHDVCHRDVKPSNVLVVGQQKPSLKLVDVGGSCDILEGTNYDPDEAILDPEYGPPEMYVDAQGSGALKGRKLWKAARPELFDAYSVGLVVFQLAVPAFRGRGSMKKLRKQLSRRENAESLQAWRANNGSKLDSSNLALLDANDGKGWDFVSRLVRPRKFASFDGKERMSVKEALRCVVLSASELILTSSCNN